MAVKPPIDRDFLKDPLNPHRKVSLMDALTLLRCIHEGAAHPKVGFVDANQTLNQMSRKLSRAFWVKQSVLESALWSCNMLDELGLFKDFRGRTFEQFVRDILDDSVEFNRFWNLIEKKEDK